MACAGRPEAAVGDLPPRMGKRVPIGVPPMRCSCIFQRMASEQTVLDALRGIKDPDSQKDIVMSETINTGAAKAKAKAANPTFEAPKFEMPNFDLPKFEVPAAFRDRFHRSVRALRNRQRVYLQDDPVDLRCQGQNGDRRW